MLFISLKVMMTLVRKISGDEGVNPFVLGDLLDQCRMDLSYFLKITS